MILITGATGNVGKELVKRLARREAPLRVMVRDRNKARSIAYPGVEIVEGDFDRAETLDNALSGADKAFLLTSPSERQPELETNFIRAAERSNLKHLVKLSAMGAALDSPARLLRAHAESERRIGETGVPYTFLRPNQFMQNFLSYRESIIQRGEFYAPMGAARISVVDVRDIAAVAAEVLTAPAHQGKTYFITGPESLTYAGMAERLTAELGKPVAYVDVPPEAAGDAMLQSGMPRWTVDAVLELFALWKVNSAAEVADTVKHEGKKDPITFAEFAHDYAPQFGRTAPRDALGEIIDTLTLDNMTPGS
jgi:uncharacterized protein YbjT (DUF2867 family)